MNMSSQWEESVVVRVEGRMWIMCRNRGLSHHNQLTTVKEVDNKEGGSEKKSCNKKHE